MSKVYPGNIKLAREHLRLAREFKSRAFELDPSLRPGAPALAHDSAPTMALDAADAAAEQIINRAVRKAMRAEIAKPHKPTPKVTPMRSSSSFNADRLFQRETVDSYARTNTYRRPAARRHAFDAEPDHSEALEQVQKMHNHLASVRDGSSEFDPERLGKYFRAMMEAMTGGEEDDAEDGLSTHMSPEHEREYLREEEGYSDQELGGSDRKRARDALGETEARSVVTTRGSDRSSAHDAAPFDADALLQRSRP